MKAEVTQQRRLRQLVDNDAELARIGHRAKTLVEQQRVDELLIAVTAAEDAVAAVSIALADLDGAIAKLENEIDGVRKREDRDRALLDSGVNDKQQAELAHELQTLERRQSDLEDAELEIMEQRESLAARHAEATDELDQTRNDLRDAEGRATGPAPR